MIVGAIQPGYMPWLGFFDIMNRADVFVVEDCLQYTKQDWRNRNRIRSANGAAYLTVPVKKGPAERKINEVEIDSNQPWRQKHLNMLRQNYARAPYWKHYQQILEEVYATHWQMLIDLDMWWIEFIAHELGIQTPLVKLSQLDLSFSTDKTGSLIALTKKLNGDSFLEGASGQSFLDAVRFSEEGLTIIFQDYQCKPYHQQYEPFMSHLSAIDLILNEGPNARDFL